MAVQRGHPVQHRQPAGMRQVAQGGLRLVVAVAMSAVPVPAAAAACMLQQQQQREGRRAAVRP